MNETLHSGTLTTRKAALIHLVFWLLIAYFTFVKNPIHAKFLVPNLFYCTYVMVFVSTFYVHYFVVMRRVFHPFNWKKLLLGLIVSYLFFTGMRWLVEQEITRVLFGEVNYTSTTLLNYLLDNMHYSSMPILFSSFLWLGIYFVRLLEYNHAIVEENQITEIKFLKAQINPHFVFNTLNNIYSMVYFKSDQSLLAIEKLSHVMRFTTYEAQKEKIYLQDEINYMKAYIELEQLRHQDAGEVKFTIQTRNDYLEVPPYILSPLVENALKHGVLTKEMTIEIDLKVDQQSLVFAITNEIGTQKKDKLGGIGLDNLQKRLQIHYPNKHTLTLTNAQNRFTAILTIAL
ncbi:histidine kinase [Chitinophaga skermanii]|uniref:Histidine kinase n=1 Tax=Chitinophaga skermanii TaxID=331697 RepID=A0A327R376_9BACT|nr:histidine kinase [Chitinophaga skermanii]RAJ08337.1 histidine kinase [Chitinophaga skermanii]